MLAQMLLCFVDPELQNGLARGDACRHCGTLDAVCHVRDSAACLACGGTPDAVYELWVGLKSMAADHQPTRQN
ncbi:hypothetical protein L2E82_05392 [Cichorium intybus]|uniref:Uncharacterized protein n=1 Tax=Cichorium intybus TaxID=13427 RepID=A0ACB9H773_CICIN|nr:hypothetical protein L2E82_05392 [Cichorium intybus]